MGFELLQIHDAEFIESVSKQYGEEHVELKQYGFKPDFWVAVADAMTLEGVILDMANHQVCRGYEGIRKATRIVLKASRTA